MPDRERICVCGLGKVGRPILDMLCEMGFATVGYDSNPNLTDMGVYRSVEQTDAVIVIVPTPSLPTGAFSNHHVKAALAALSQAAEWLGKKDYLYIVSSTVVPGSCDEFRSIVGDNIVYKPEFIRLEHVHEDLRNPAFVLIGEAREEAGNRCEAIFRKFLGPGCPERNIPFHRMSLIEAELAKITLNCALTMKISLANQLHLVAQKLGADSKKIMECVGSDPRIGPAYLTPGWPYGGPCLPRDNRMFAYVAAKAGVHAALSVAADFINTEIDVLTRDERDAAARLELARNPDSKPLPGPNDHRPR